MTIHFPKFSIVLFYLIYGICQSVGDLLEIPVLPAYTSPFAAGRNILRGVNYASAAGGILEVTGQNLVLITFSGYIYSQIYF